jgi:hypothetical protein
MFIFMKLKIWPLLFSKKEYLQKHKSSYIPANAVFLRW